MKKLVLTAALALSSFGFAFSQKFVDTTQQNRNVILEEYTGIYCQYCPDGHKIAGQLAEANPGRVFLVNIHAGGYAEPDAGDIDLRTAEGNALLSLSKISSFPSGTINRTKSATPWGVDRTTWAASAKSVLGKASIVNVAVKSHVDFITEELVTDVQFYYTGTSAKTANYLTVMLTQSNILGTQTGGSTYNPTQMTTDGQYIHKHALRGILSSNGATGEKLDTVKAGTFGSRRYITKLPSIIGNVGLSLVNLNVVAFIAESQTNILSGSGSEVTYNTESKMVDLALDDLTNYPTSLCVSKITPMIQVTNNSDSVIKSFDVYATINGIEHKKSFTGSIEKDNYVNINFGEIEFDANGTNAIQFTGFKNINNNTVYDLDSRSNNAFSASTTGFKKNATSYFSAGFDDGKYPSNTAFDYTENKKFGIVSSTSAIGANNSFGAVQFYLHSSWGIEGLSGNIIIGELDLSKIVLPELTYYYAYSDGEVGGSAPTITVQASENCGDTWVDVTSPLELTENGQPDNPDYLYVPKTTDYTKVAVSLAAFQNKSVLLKISGVPGSSGNAMYIDEIAVSYPTNVTEDTKINLSLYPNPADLEIRLNDKNALGLEYSIFNLLGEVVAKGVNNENRIDINSLNSGCYYIQINNTTQKFVKK